MSETKTMPGPGVTRPTALVVVSRSARVAGKMQRHHLDALTAKGYVPRILQSATESEIQAAAESGLAPGSIVIVVGGDGTVNHVLNALREHLLPLLVLPAGTANDLAGELGSSPDVRDGLARLQSSRLKRIDLLRVNGRLFSSTGGLGLPAESALRVNRLRENRLVSRSIDFLGARVYRLSALGHILFERLGFPVRLDYLDADRSWRHLNTHTAGVLVANQGRLAAGLCFSPSSRNDDARFEIALLPARSKMHLLGILHRLSRRSPLSPHDLTILQTTEAILECERTRAFFGDGELLEESRKFHLSIWPNALEVI